jgi:haloalkane dehalogenase
MESDARAGESFREYGADRGGHRIRVRDYPGSGPAIVLMHGFPDDLHLYDRVLPFLVGVHRVVTFDFLGWGESDKPAGYPYTADNQTGDLDAVIRTLDADQVVLVAHDASGPPAIDWALAHPERVTGLVLLNTYYSRMLRLRPPEAIMLYSIPLLRILTRAVMHRFEWLDKRLYFWQVGRFIRDDDIRAELLPPFYRRFRATRAAFERLNSDLLPTVYRNMRKTAALRKFPRPVWIVFGTEDPYLNVHVARRFAELFPHPRLELIDGARHYVQVDEPAKVAEAIRRAAQGSAAT